MGGKSKGGGSTKASKKRDSGKRNSQSSSDDTKRRGGATYGSLDEDENMLKHGGKNGARKGKKGRGSNERKVYGNTSDDTQLRNAVESDGKKTIIDMSADGNCLFRSLSDQLYHDMGNNHAEVRSDVCDFMEGHEEDFSVFLVLPDDDDHQDEDENDSPRNAHDEEDAANFGSYVDNMRQDGEWGGNLELVAAARLYRRNITVFSATLAAFTIEHGSAKKSTGPDLLVSYHDNDHYNSVRDNTRPKPSPPVKTYSKPTSVVLASDHHNLDDYDEKKAEEDAWTGRGSRDCMEDVEVVLTVNPATAALEAFDAAEDAKRNRATIESETVKKSDPCPCGSGERYKKCCLAKAKREAKLHKLKGIDSCETIGRVQPDDEETTEMNGTFRVLKI